jgi:hypothetical protein
MKSPDGRTAEPGGTAHGICFEFGPDSNYSSRTAVGYGGLQITPRRVFAPLANLKPGGTLHDRLVGVNSTGTSLGKDSQFQAANE